MITIENLITSVSQLDVVLAQSLKIVRGPSDGDFVVNIAPFRAVIVVLRTFE